METPEFVRAYMKRRCVCGLLREEHGHFQRAFRPGESTPTGAHGTDWAVMPILTPPRPCAGFTDAVELELGGCPIDNPHFGPVVTEQLLIPPGTPLS